MFTPTFQWGHAVPWSLAVIIMSILISTQTQSYYSNLLKHLTWAGFPGLRWWREVPKQTSAKKTACTSPGSSKVFCQLWSFHFHGLPIATGFCFEVTQEKEIPSGLEETLGVYAPLVCIQTQLFTYQRRCLPTRSCFVPNL